MKKKKKPEDQDPKSTNITVNTRDAERCWHPMLPEKNQVSNHQRVQEGQMAEKGKRV